MHALFGRASSADLSFYTEHSTQLLDKEGTTSMGLGCQRTRGQAHYSDRVQQKPLAARGEARQGIRNIVQYTFGPFSRKIVTHNSSLEALESRVFDFI